MGISQEDEELQRENLLSTDLLTHIRHFFKKSKGYSFEVSNFHKKAIQAFQDVMQGTIQNLLLLMPPRHGKTEIAKSFCTMGFALNPASEFIYGCSDLALALDCSSEIRNTIKSLDYQAMWDISIRIDTSAKGLWKTDQGGTFWAGNFGSPIIGYGAGKHPRALKGKLWKFGGAILIDDPIKEQDRFRATIREEIITFFRDTIPFRRNNGKYTPMVVFMQPLHKEDLGQWIKENRKDFTVLEFPIINEKNEVLYPEKYTFDELMEIKAQTSNEAWMSKFMMTPIAIGGNILKTKYLKYYKELPFLKHRWIEADTAQKTEERHDYTVFQCWGKGYEGGIYLIDQFRKKVEYSELKQRFKDFWYKHNSIENYNPKKYGTLTRAFIEDKSSGTQILQECKVEGNIPVVEVPRSRGKYERAVDVALPKLEAGYINVPEEKDFMSDFKDEMEDFTGQEDSKQAILKMDKKKTFDDQVDCFISACEHGFTEFVSDSKVIKSFMDKRLKRGRNV